MEGYKIKQGSAMAEGPRDALCQLKSCQLQRNCTKKIAFELEMRG